MTIKLADGLTRKLALRPGMTVRILDAPAGYSTALAAALPEVVVSEADGPAPADAAIGFARTEAELQLLAPRAIDAVRRDGPLWLLYPKGGSGVATDLKRDVMWGPLELLGYQPVSQVAMDATWSALRFRPSEAVGR